MAERSWVITREAYLIGLEESSGASWGCEIILRLDTPDDDPFSMDAMEFEQFELDMLVIRAIAERFAQIRISDHDNIRAQPQYLPPEPVPPKPGPNSSFTDIVRWCEMAVGSDPAQLLMTRFELAELGEAIYGTDWTGPLAAAMKLPKTEVEARFQSLSPLSSQF